MKKEWKSIRKGTLIEINSPTNGRVVVRVAARHKAFGHGRVMAGKKRSGSPKYYMFNQLMFNKGRITILTDKTTKLLYGD